MSKKQKRTENLTRQEFKDKVKEYFSMVESQNKQRKVEGGVRVPITPPGLAQHLNWSTDKLVTYSEEDGLFHDVIQVALQQCETYIVNAIFSKELDKSIGTMMLKTYFGYSDSKSKTDAKLAKAKRSISKVLDELDDAVPKK